MDLSDQEYWNLCQAALWVEFRSQPYVEKHGAEDADGYKALHWYPEKDQPRRQAEVSELHEALKSNSLLASGYHVDEPNVIKEIPPLNWYDIDLRPPHAFDARNRGEELWTQVRLKRRDALRLWPRAGQPASRAWYDWDAIQQILEDVSREEGEVSQNQLILAIQDRFERQFKRRPPSRSRIQTALKEWRRQASRLIS